MTSFREKSLQILEQFAKLGAEINTREVGYTPDEIADVEASVGFSLPQEYQEFLIEFGQIGIDLERTWFFYGLESGLAKTTQYRDHFESMVASGMEAPPVGPYFPKRFFVLADEGDYANRATGWVYDDDLDGFLHTFGGKWVEAGHARKIGYWQLLYDELTSAYERIQEEAEYR